MELRLVVGFSGPRAGSELGRADRLRGAIARSCSVLVNDRWRGGSGLGGAAAWDKGLTDGKGCDMVEGVDIMKPVEVISVESDYARLEVRVEQLERGRRKVALLIAGLEQLVGRFEVAIAGVEGDVRELKEKMHGGVR